VVDQWSVVSGKRPVLSSKGKWRALGIA